MFEKYIEENKIKIEYAERILTYLDLVYEGQFTAAEAIGAVRHLVTDDIRVYRKGIERAILLDNE